MNDGLIQEEEQQQQKSSSSIQGLLKMTTDDASKSQQRQQQRRINNSESTSTERHDQEGPPPPSFDEDGDDAATVDDDDNVIISASSLNIGSNSKPPMSRKELRRQRRQQRNQFQRGKKKKHNIETTTTTSSEEDDNSSSCKPHNGDDDDDDNDDDQLLELFHDDHSSAWQETVQAGALWGGRGKGGRGVRVTGDNFQSISLPSVTLQFSNTGLTLLQDSPMHITKGRRYGVLGRNGVGKSTLFRALAHHLIPGLPHTYRVLLVNQQLLMPGSNDDQTVLQAMLEADVDRSEVLKEQEQVESELEQGVNVLENAAKLERLLLEWDAMDGDGAEDRAKFILTGLGFDETMLSASTSQLSGGWRMRLSLARALFVKHIIDLLLLDEVSNHLDLHGMLWLQEYLCNASDLTMMVISHDRDFLGAVTTDMIVMKHERLTYFPGNYWEFKQHQEEYTTMQVHKLEAAEKQRQKALEFVQKQQIAATKSTDPNKQRQAKTIKDKKMERIGMFREDGKKFKNFSLKQLDMKSSRMAQHVQLEREDRVIAMKFPNPTWPTSVVDHKSPIITLEDVGFSYDSDSSNANMLLQHLSLHVDRGSKIALVGRNGSGKSTLVKLLTGELPSSSTGNSCSGHLWRHANLRIGHVSQYSVEELDRYAKLTVVEYTEKLLADKRALKHVLQSASSKGYGNNVRQYLGAFGLGGAHAHRSIKSLSGGERMRLCFCTELADEPHLLMLDESSNHLDLETLDSLAVALQQFEGAVVMVSHNQGFLRMFANTLWICENGTVQALYSSDSINDDGGNASSGSTTNSTTFDDLFGHYRSQVMTQSAAASRTQARKQQKAMAKKASQQSSGATSRSGLL